MSEDKPAPCPEKIIADLLCSTLFHAHETGRNHLFCWERDGLRWLRALKHRQPISDWTATFIKVNGPCIDGDDSATINWNLRAASLIAPPDPDTER